MRGDLMMNASHIVIKRVTKSLHLESRSQIVTDYCLGNSRNKTVQA